MIDDLSGREFFHPIAYMESMLARLEMRQAKAVATMDWDSMREYDQRIDYLKRRLAYELSGVGA